MIQLYLSEKTAQYNFGTESFSCPEIWEADPCEIKIATQGGQQIFKTEFQTFRAKNLIFPGLNLFFLGLTQATKDFLHA